MDNETILVFDEGADPSESSEEIEEFYRNYPEHKSICEKCGNVNGIGRGDITNIYLCDNCIEDRKLLECKSCYRKFLFVDYLVINNYHYISDNFYTFDWICMTCRCGKRKDYRLSIDKNIYCVENIMIKNYKDLSKIWEDPFYSSDKLIVLNYSIYQHYKKNPGNTRYSGQDIMIMNDKLGQFLLFNKSDLCEIAGNCYFFKGDRRTARDKIKLSIETVLLCFKFSKMSKTFLNNISVIKFSYCI